MSVTCSSFWTVAISHTRTSYPCMLTNQVFIKYCNHCKHQRLLKEVYCLKSLSTSCTLGSTLALMVMMISSYSVLRGKNEILLSICCIVIFSDRIASDDKLPLNFIFHALIHPYALYFLTVSLRRNNSDHFQRNWLLIFAVYFLKVWAVPLD